jgi:hypothetical protein
MRTVKTRTPKSPPTSSAGVGTRWFITIPGWKPFTLNELLKVHWAKAGRMKAADRGMVAAYAILEGVPPATGKRRVSLRVVLPKGAKRWDLDNTWKSLLDACVQCKILKNDSPDWCETGDVEFVRGEVFETTILLEEMT